MINESELARDSQKFRIYQLRIGLYDEETPNRCGECEFGDKVQRVVQHPAKFCILKSRKKREIEIQRISAIVNLMNL